MFLNIKTQSKRALSLLLSLLMLLSSMSLSFTASAKSKVNTYEAPYDLTVVNYSETTAKIKWKLKGKLTSNAGFQVLVYSKKKGKYVNKGHIRTKSFELKNLPQSDIRKVKVRTYVKKKSKKYYGEAALIKIPKPVSKPKITDLTLTKKGRMTVSWKGDEDASGYILRYSTSSKFDEKYTSTVIIEDNVSSTLIKGLAQDTYYFRLAAFKDFEGVRYASKWSAVSQAEVEKGYTTFKGFVNVYETDMSGRKAVLKLTKKGVDISKFETTYDRLEAIYIWHVIHAQSFASCYYFTINFNKCVDALFGETRKFDKFIWMGAGNFQNRSGGRPVHKWPVLFFAGQPFICDGRIEGYIDENCFGLEKDNPTAKRFLLDSWYMSFRDNDLYKDGLIVKYKVLK